MNNLVLILIQSYQTTIPREREREVAMNSNKTRTYILQELRDATRNEKIDASLDKRRHTRAMRRVNNSNRLRTPYYSYLHVQLIHPDGVTAL